MIPATRKDSDKLVPNEVINRRDVSQKTMRSTFDGGSPNGGSIIIAQVQ
jgi:hypothetical protein